MKWGNMRKFIKGVESLVDPINVGTIHFMQMFNAMLPISVQNKIIKTGAKNNPVMGFVVDPYSYFLAYEVTDVEGFSKYLPEHFVLEPTSLFEEEEKRYSFLLGCFNARTSGFIGNRVEAYAIAKDTRTGLISWVILDYVTNTISYDEKHGLTSPNYTSGVITTNFNEEIIVDMVDEKHAISFISSLKNSVYKKPDQRLWIDGNLSVAYGSNLSDDGGVFSLLFYPGEMQKALYIENDKITIEQNSFYKDYTSDQPYSLLCYPFAQHYVSDSPGVHTYIKDEEELVERVNGMEFDNGSVYSAKDFKNMILISPAILTFIIIILTILLIIKW